MWDFAPHLDTASKRNRTMKVRHSEELALPIERAARSLGVSKSDFVRASVEREARRVLEVRSQHVLTPEDLEQFVAALDAPPAPTPRALEAARNYRVRVIHAE